MWAPVQGLTGVWQVHPMHAEHWEGDPIFAPVGVGNPVIGLKAESSGLAGVPASRRLLGRKFHSSS